MRSIKRQNSTTFSIGGKFRPMPEISIKQIEHFFAHYKDLEPGKWVKIDHWGHADEAKKLIMAAIARANEA